MSEADKNQEPKTDSELKVFFTEDKQLIEDYCALRHQAYNEDNGWKAFDGSKNRLDEWGRICVVIKDGEVIGGARLMLSNECQYLSSEVPGTQYEYKKYIRKYDLREDMIISEVSALAVVKKYRNRSISTKLLDLLIRESQKCGAHYIFGTAVAVTCREYRLIFNSIGYYLEIAISYPWKQYRSYDFVKSFPIFTKLG